MKRVGLLGLALALIVGLPAGSKAAPSSAPPAAPVVTKSQVLLRNYIVFKGGQKSQGASAFLLKLGATTYAVTVKHMLGEDMGIEPPVPPSQVNAELKTWLFYIPGTETVVAQADHIVTPNDNLRIDRIAFAIGDPAIAAQAGVQSLILAPSLPQSGATVYVMGCVYAEENCHQTVYRMTYLQNLDGYLVVKPIDPVANFSGFSGAPVVDAEGRAIALVRGSASEGKFAGDIVLYNLIGIDTEIQP